MIDISRLHNELSRRTKITPFRHPLLKLQTGLLEVGLFLRRRSRLRSQIAVDDPLTSRQVVPARVDPSTGGEDPLDLERDLDLAAIWRSSEPMMSLRDRRHSVLLHASVATERASVGDARVRNISRGGLMVECRLRGEPGDRVEVSLRGLGELAGRVAWVGDERIGVMFDEPVEPEIVLRGPIRRHDDGCVRRPPSRAWRPALHGA
jgi:hypothetical protein